MGVHGLWELLAPVGRRVSVETLSGKKLAIDASIWMIQFMKAMRDEKGEMVRNAHLIGFFRRICKLLYLRTKPVFVFDGGTPALKRRTVVARRRLRENAQAKIRKTAEKLLLNHLKEMRLKELAKDLKDQRMKQEDDDAKEKNVLMDNAVLERSKLDEMLAESIVAEENESLHRNELAEGEEDADEDEEMILPSTDGKIDPSILAALPQSMQLDLLMRESSIQGNMKINQGIKQNDKRMNSAKCKEILSDETDFEENNLARNDVVAEMYNQENLDEMLAASIAAEEDKTVNKNASTSGAAIPSEDGGDEDEDMILPDVPGKVDPAVLAALPPSMQLDLLVQMRERLMAENRQRYQKVKKAPEKFSELQIEAYLKTVAFRREIDQVQKAASGHGVGGVQTSRIASEANREFIFSSSFTGDKQLFISTEVQRNGDMQQKTPIQHPASTSDNVTSIGKSSAVTGLDLDESRRVFDDDVETYLDERGRIRVSRLRAMGLRMTRDLQRNLDLMKEIEKEKAYPSKSGSSQTAPDKNEDGSAKNVASKSEKVHSTSSNGGGSVDLNEGDGECMLNNENSIQISFEVDEGSKHADSDDDIFACLVVGKPIEIASADNNLSRRQPSDSNGDWDEGITEEKVYGSFNNLRSRNNSSFEEGENSDGSEVEWEEGVCCDATNSPCPPESGKSISKGQLEEESDLQEAIRRSLKDIGTGKLYHAQSEADNSKNKENVYESVRIPDQDNNIADENVKQKDSVERDNSLTFELESLDVINSSEALPLEKQNKPSETHGTGESHGRLLEACASHNLNRATSLAADRSLPIDVNLVVAQSSDSSVKDNASSASTKFSSDGFHTSKSVSDGKLVNERTNYMEATLVGVDDIQSVSASEPSRPSVEITESSVPFDESSARESIKSIGIEQKFAEENNTDISDGGKHRGDKSAVMNDEDGQPIFTEASLEEEILNLGQECMNLGYEQRKLERNAESVSSEMFAECQELLQMFGLPYIIAPMEAEAQCAYMELVNLVDGVVTDDSDVLLFGARSVYKNIFDDRKYVETYFMKDIEKELGLTREKLIRMALLLGSDYTEGVSGIGIVNAIEVVNAFPEDDGLHKFREWIESPDPTILGNFGAQTRKKGAKVIHESLNGSNATTEESTQTDKDKQSADDLKETKQVFMNKHRNVSKNWHIPSSFPSEAVISAYSCPQVDKSTEPFSWGKPDIHLLRRLCWEKFGWGIQKSDELLVPVLNEYNKHETQLRLEAFYTFNERFAKIRSKRIKKAVKGITGTHSVDVLDDTQKEVHRSGKKRSIGSADSNGNKSAKTSKKKVETVPGNGSSFLGEGPDQQCQVEGEHSSCDGRNGNGESRGRGRGRGKGRGKGSVRSKQSGSSSGDDFNNSADEPEIHGEKLEGSRELRRSARSRKPAQYTVENMEIDDVDESLYEGNRKRSNEEITEQGLSSGVCMDASAEIDHKQPLETENSILGDDNSLERGGGFCIDEGETAQPGVSQSSSPFNVDVSEDYLTTGGGFCLDESNDQSAACTTPTDPAKEVAEASNLSEFHEEYDRGSNAAQPISRVSRAISELSDGGKRKADVGPDVNLVDVIYCGDYSKADASRTESTRANAEASGIQGLSPMPLLKRKKRKS